MKKTIWTIMVIIISAVVVAFVACNKESEIQNNETVQSSVKMANGPADFCPHFKYRFGYSQDCTAKSGSFCGFDIDAVLNGDEVCYLMMKDGDPYRFILPKTVLLSNSAGVVIDSARTGSMTFNSDFEILSQSMAKDLGIDLIPAGRYPAFMTTYQGDSVVRIQLDTVL